MSPTDIIRTHNDVKMAPTQTSLWCVYYCGAIVELLASIKSLSKSPMMVKSLNRPHSLLCLYLMITF